jgi:glycogen debranching enzyme
MKRLARGHDLPAEVSEDSVILSYRGLDSLVRRTALHFEPAPLSLTRSEADFDLLLQPRQEVTFLLTVGCEGSAAPPILHFDDARAEAQADLERFSAWTCHLRTSNSQMNAWINRAVSDLHMLTTELPTGPYPYAGVPWFNTPFGRDGIITALESLWLRPGLARGVLSYLAATQATELNEEQDAEPGKILHETRTGEMATLHEMPFGRYYGSVDATPLFALLAGEYYRRTGDLGFVKSIWPNIEAALSWIDDYGDRDGDGFVEYQRQTQHGLVHQGWKDSDDAVFHADGSTAEGPIALCEVQGYVYAARRAAAILAAALGFNERAAGLERQAIALQEEFERAFWCEDLSTYAMALDGDKRPCRIRSSNAGQCFFTGIVRPDHALRTGHTLFGAESFSRWGIRTLASSEARYNPMGYHTGSVWPHDNALIAFGLSRYGLAQRALQLLTALFEASRYFELYRMPELFCGFAQQSGEGPVLYPVACTPQAWSAASVFLLFQSCLGLEISSPDARICLTSPCLPAAVDELRIHKLEVGGATVDLLLVRHDYDVSVNVTRRDGEVQVVVIK